MRRLAVLLFAAAGAASAAPAPGRYDATFCVTTSADQPASCGPAEFDLFSKSRAEVRVADVAYRLHLLPTQIDVMTKQGTMEIDEFSAAFEWNGDVLTFIDLDKHVRYEVKPGARIGAKR